LEHVASVLECCLGAVGCPRSNFVLLKASKGPQKVDCEKCPRARITALNSSEIGFQNSDGFFCWIDACCCRGLFILVVENVQRLLERKTQNASSFRIAKLQNRAETQLIWKGVEPSGERLKLFEGVRLSMGHLPMDRTVLDRLQSKGRSSFSQLRKISPFGAADGFERLRHLRAKQCWILCLDA